VAVVSGGGGERNLVDSDKGEGLGYGGGYPEELGVRRIWEGEPWRHREGQECSSQKACTYGTSDHLWV
jgi:hypothetical protein